MERATLRVDGVVQSVGFRPFVYRQAVAHSLHGTVRNLGDAGVRIELEGAEEDVDAFLRDFRRNPPPLAQIEALEVDREPADKSAFDGFKILESAAGDADSGSGTIPPDVAICENCLKDIRDPDSRYHGYWATACVDCGPRYTIIESLPYDRLTTSMAAFPMCDDCRAEYEDPSDRRYHAQTIACPTCGPTLRYGELDGEHGGSGAAPSTAHDPFREGLADVEEGSEAIKGAADTVADEGIIVVKGIGGAHIVCDATDPGTVAQLRERTGRTEKPFALMAPDLPAVEGFTDLSDAERETLQSFRRPILLVGHTGGVVAPNVAPGLHTVGVMLPYSGVHHLLFDHVDGPLVMTSANLPGRPMLTANGPLLEGLADVADGFLLHDRRIIARCDDSLARVVDGRHRLLRRSRGYAPTPVPLSGAEGPVLAVGPELDVTAVILHDGDCYLTQYVGDIDELETFDYLKNAVDHLLDVTGLEHPAVVAHDAHPDFNTTHYAKELVAAGDADQAVPVQHHHAHAVSVLAEHGRSRAIALTLDGVGYGADGTVWGGEVLDAGQADFERIGGLAPVPMPGGDLATQHPSRLAAGLLYAADPDRVGRRLERHGITFPDGAEERDVVIQQLDADVNVPETSSAGRFLDAVSALCGVCTERKYEGEPAMKLEAVAAEGRPQSVEIPRATVDGRSVVDTPTLFVTLAESLADGTSTPDVAATAQECLAVGLAEMAVETAVDRAREAVALSGGVAYNDHIVRSIRARVEDAALKFLTNERVPAGDGGIAYGQAAVAAAQFG